MAMFKGFKPQGLQKIATKMGYAGRMEEFDNYLQQNPEKQREMIVFQSKAQEMARGGSVVRMAVGGFGNSSDDGGSKPVGPFYTGKDAPKYQDYLKSPEYAATQTPFGGVGASVVLPVEQGGNTYNFGNAVQGEAYQKYMANQPKQVQPSNRGYTGGGAPPVFNDGVNINQPLKAGMEQQVPGFPKTAPPEQIPFNVPIRDNERMGVDARGRNMEDMPQINNYTQGYTPGYVNPFPMQEGPERDKFRKRAEDERKQTAKAPVLNLFKDLEGYDLTKIDKDGFAPEIGGGGGRKVQAYKDRAQKEYNEKLKKHQEYQKIFGENYTVGQAQDYDREQGTIKRNENLKKLNPKFDLNYYNSPEFKEFSNSPSNMVGTMDVRFSPYFGQQGSGSVGGAADASYISYLKRTGQDTLIKEGVISQDKQNNPFGVNIPIDSSAKLGDTSIPSERLPAGIIPDRKIQMDDQVQIRRPTQTTQPTGPNMATDTNIEDFSVQQALNPTLPQGGATVAADTPVTQAQMVDPNTGQLVPTGASVPSATLATTQASTAPTPTDAAQTNAALSNLQVASTVAPIQGAQGVVSQQAQLNAQQQAASSVSQLQAAQGVANVMQNPVQRQIQSGELITGVANAQAASTFAEQVEAATATPSTQATTQGQLANLTANFDASNPPSWAAGALRGIQAQMAQRGLGASSMAGQAMVQGALESALPIAQADAQTIASFEQANLSNRQQRAMLSAQQRATFIGQEFDQAFQSRVQNAAKIGDVANMNFTAEQNIALENSRAANTMNLNNIGNKQAMVIAEASALANLDMSNLNNRQQASVQNAQSFMQMDMSNLNNNQQAEMFKAQSLVQSLFTDTAATNASNQFNASSQNQTKQFFANLMSTVSSLNAEQGNAMSRYNSGEVNALSQFNSTMKNQREQFNSQNRLVIDQSNAQWRRQVATSDTATINRVNEINAKALIDMSTGAYNNLWQGFRDDMEFSWKTSDNAEERTKDILLRKMQDESSVMAAALAADQNSQDGLVDGLIALATANTGSSVVGSVIDTAKGIDYKGIWDTGTSIWDTVTKWF